MGNSFIKSDGTNHKINHSDGLFKILHTCANNSAGVIMYGWFVGTRCLDTVGGGCGSTPVGVVGPYGTYVYGDEIVIYEDGVWKYKNIDSLIVASTNGPNYPWLATWPEPYSAAKWCEPQI
jgi:hypothetical protein